MYEFIRIYSYIQIYRVNSIRVAKPLIFYNIECAVPR